jgi:hypothetical protein
MMLDVVEFKLPERVPVKLTMFEVSDPVSVIVRGKLNGVPKESELGDDVVLDKLMSRICPLTPPAPPASCPLPDSPVRVMVLLPLVIGEGEGLSENEKIGSA